MDLSHQKKRFLFESVVTGLVTKPVCNQSQVWIKSKPHLFCWKKQSLWWFIQLKIPVFMYVLPLMNRASRNCNINSLQKKFGEWRDIMWTSLKYSLCFQPTYLFALFSTVDIALCTLWKSMAIRVWEFQAQDWKGSSNFLHKSNF